jgi:hypothetical protein
VIEEKWTTVALNTHIKEEMLIKGSYEFRKNLIIKNSQLENLYIFHWPSNDVTSLREWKKSKLICLTQIEVNNLKYGSLYDISMVLDPNDSKKIE